MSIEELELLAGKIPYVIKSNGSAKHLKPL
jgi:hypothetical protein